MAVTVKIDDKAKRARAAEPTVRLDDFALPGARGEGVKAFLIWVLLMLALSAAPLAVESTRPLGIGIAAWWLLSALVYFFIAPRLVRRRLRLHGADFEINARRQPRLKTLLSKGSVMIGVDEPDGFLTEDKNTQVRIVSGGATFVIVTAGAVQTLAAPELDCLVLRCLVHARLGHTRRLTLLQFLGDTPPAARVLAWPVALYGTLLRFNWHDAAEQSADRLTLLLVKNPKLLMSAILKQFASSDPVMQEQNITLEDVDKYIKQDGLIGNTGTEISTQYKIGSAIHDNPYLDTRIRTLTSWVDAPEYVQALAKLSAKSGPKPPAAPAAKA